MPITPDYTWEETPAGLTVNVAIKGITKGALNVTCTECLLKASHDPLPLGGPGPRQSGGGVWTEPWG